jgi:tetratricopeptide (TPR) repeat protein
MSFHHLPALRMHGLIALLVTLLCLPAQADTYSDVERLITNRQWAQALQTSQAHLKEHPDDPQMRLLLSRTQDLQGQPELARLTLEALTQQFPELPEPHNNLAVLYARLGRLNDALASLDKALLARPDYAVALENLGDVHLSLAMSAYQRAQQAAPSSTGASRKFSAIAPLLHKP